MASNLGNMIEVRIGSQSQHLPIFVRMLDKDSNWELSRNGLTSVLTTTLVMSILGYPFVLPDMIGGNAYGQNRLTTNAYPDYELFIRWTQLNAFLPTMQFSIPPWFYNNIKTTDVNKICKAMVDLHEFIVSPTLLKFAHVTTETGEPIIRPMWWIDSSDAQNLIIYDQFIVGDKFLVAPVLQKGATKRDIYIPIGTWLDGNINGKSYTGPIWIRNYDSPLEIIPYFINKNATS